MKKPLNFPILIALAMPALLVAAIAGSIYFPARAISFSGRFVFVLRGYEAPGLAITVENGRMVDAERFRGAGQARRPLHRKHKPWLVPVIHAGLVTQ